jgi:hypothetical protein
MCGAVYYGFAAVSPRQIMTEVVEIARDDHLTPAFGFYFLNSCLMNKEIFQLPTSRVQVSLTFTAGN